MLATHVHCGKPMRLATADEMPFPPGADPSTTGQQLPRSVMTYRCACGFSFDRPPLAAPWVQAAAAFPSRPAAE